MTTPIKLLTTLVLLLFLSCNTITNKQVSNAKDYNTYLASATNKSEIKYQSQFDFWDNKLNETPNQYPYLAKIASANTNLFESTGDISFLIEAENNLIELNKKTNYNTAGYLRSLARNYISQHRFGESLELLIKAEDNAENLKATQKMLFDVHLELGNIELAKSYLEKIKNLSDFDYLIRLAKWSDHQGNLEATLKYMEQAVTIAESSKLKGLIQWSYTNIADYYGHDGQIKKSYNHFLKALELNPDNAYAKKGIAWIIYSHERNPKEALRILNTITQKYNAPDYYLLKAEIAEYLNDDTAKAEYLSKYFEAVENTKYGVMYDAHNAVLLAEETKQLEQAIALAKSEVKRRPTAQSFDLLAWAYFNNNQPVEALNIAQNYVIGKTHEPQAMFHVAQIYKANGMKKEAENIKKELLSSIFELGPTMEQKIKNI
ncbi:tetratricopeptide repeat protein [Lacinutrix salivirga]